MAHDPKIELFKFSLKRKGSSGAITFREFFRSKFNHYYDITPAPSTDNCIFKIYFEDFIKDIGKDTYKTDSKKKKGFTIGIEEDDNAPETLIDLSSDKMFIDGILFGGKYNAERLLSKIHNTKEKSKINRDNIVSDKYYFLLYTPLNHSEGILIIQGYSESKISDIIRKHLKEYFKYFNEWSIAIEPFIPQQFRDNFKKDAKFKKVVFSSSWDISEHDYETITGRNQHIIEVKIEIIDKNKKKTDAEIIPRIVKWFGKSKFKLNNEPEKELEAFENKEAKMENNGKVLDFNFDDENDITPSIVLTGGEYFNEDNSPNLDSIKEYCRNLLVEVLEETSPLNGVQES